MDNILTHECLIGDARHDKFTILSEHDNIVDIRTINHKLILFEPHTHEALFPVDVQFGVIGDDLSSLYGVEGSDLGAALAALTIFIQQSLVIVYGKIGEMLEMILSLP